MVHDTKETWVGLVLIVGVVVAIASCDSVQQAPKLITADGEGYVACSNLVWVTSDGGGLLGGSTTFKVSFTDASGVAHVLRGVKKVEMMDVPKETAARMPIDPSSLDRDFQPLVSGQIYHWRDGSQALYRNGQWEPVKVPSQVCPS